MFKNYFYLHRCIKDITPLLIGKQVLEIYTQEKDKLFINATDFNQENFHIIISTNPQFPYLTFKEDHHKAKKNVKNFFNDFLPDKISKVEIALGDRIIKISLDYSSIYFVIRGSKTNIFLIDSNSNIRFFKKVEEDFLESIKHELLGTKFISRPEPILELFESKSKAKILNQYKFIDKDTIREAEKRSGDWNNNLINIVNEIYNSPIAVVMDDNLLKPVFAPSSFLNCSPDDNYPDYFAAINKYISLFYSIAKDKIIKNQLEKFVDKELERLSNKLNNLKSRIEAGSKEEVYFRQANLLLSNISFLKTGMKEVEIDDLITNQKVKIKLDEKVLPQKNVDQYFEKARSEKINFQKSKELFALTENDYLKLIKLRDRVKNSISLDDLISIKKEMKFKMDTRNNDPEKERTYNFRHFIIEGKYHLYIGRDGKNNDLLTTKFAKQNDFWFHARSVPGSHAVLRVENTKEVVPKHVLKKAASIAAFYSKAKTSKLASVSYTFKKYVVKKKDLDPGQVILLKENVLLVHPEMPVDCEMVGDE